MGSPTSSRDMWTIHSERKFLTSTRTDGRREWPMPGCYGVAILTWVKLGSAPVSILASITLEEQPS